jgi:pilus assembly protein FimV
VRSGVGEPLRAEIEILGASGAERASLDARLATPEESWRAGVEPAPVVQSIRVGIARRASGRPVVTLASDQPVEEPFMSLLVQLSSRRGQSMREYPVLLEERQPRPLAAPSLDSGAPPAAPGAPAAVVGPVEVANGPASRQRSHRVEPGETLATIAEAHRNAGVTLEQMLAALYRANPDAFLGSNMNRLRAGLELEIPYASVAAAIAREDAKRLVAEHLAASGTDRLRVSRPGGAQPAGGASGDDVASLQLEAREARERIALLQKSVEGLQKLVEAQGRQLARLREAYLAATGAHRPGDAVASDLLPFPPAAAEPGIARALARFAGEQWGWLGTAFLLAFTAWVWMPLKTVRLWRRKRRRDARAERRAARKVRRRVRARRLDAATPGA